jgi:hypothetical protein
MSPRSDARLRKSNSNFRSRLRGSPGFWRRQPKRLRRAIVAIVLVAVAAGGVWGSKNGYSWYREWQVDRNLEKAQIAARLQDWPEARNLSRSVLLARPKDLEAYRIWHRALSKMEEPRTYMAAAQLFMDERATREDKMETLRVMSHQAPQAIALSAFASLEPALQESAEARAAMADLLLFRGQIDLVESMLREIENLSDYPAAQLELLRALCARPTRERVDEARQLFAALVEQDASQEALKALEVLGETPGGLAPGDPLPALPEWVAKQQKATDLHHLLALHPEIEAASPDLRKVMFTVAADRFIATAPGIVGTWLTKHQQQALAAEVLEEPAKTRPDAYISRLNALLREGRTSEVDELLASPPPATDGLEMELVQVAVARFRQDQTAETSAWNRVLYQALLDSSRNRLLDVARYAEQLGVPWAAERAWVAGVRVGWGRIPLHMDFLPLFASLLRQNRTHDLLAMCRSLMRYEPGNIELQNNFYYLALIHAVIPPAEAEARLTKLAEDHPDMPELYSGPAMAALMAGHPERTLEWLPTLEESPRISPMTCAAMRGTALLLEGNKEEAEAVLANVNWNALLYQENVVFRRLLTTTSVGEVALPELDEGPVSDGIEETAAWKKAMERLERDRVDDTLPALPTPRIPSNDQVEDTLPALPTPRIPSNELKVEEEREKE